MVRFTERSVARSKRTPREKGVARRMGERNADWRFWLSCRIWHGSTSVQPATLGYACETSAGCGVRSPGSAASDLVWERPMPRSSHPRAAVERHDPVSGSRWRRPSERVSSASARVCRLM